MFGRSPRRGRVNALDRLRLLRDTLPAHGSITLNREALSELLGEAQPEQSAPAPTADLTVEEVGAELRRSPSRVRDFIRAGELRAYKFGKEYRVTRAALDAFVEAQRAGRSDRSTAGERVNLGRWRTIRNVV